VGAGATLSLALGKMTNMERATFLKNYRLRLRFDGSPYEPDRNGPAFSHQAVDERTGEPVFVTLIPVESIGSNAREKFEEQASAMQKLRHVNIAKVLDFGREGDDYVYVSEHLPGESLATWVQNHGPMAADAALRIAEQIVSVLSSVSFHKLPYPSIQPSDIIIVPGQTPEGTWPPVKLTNVGLPALRSDGESFRAEAQSIASEPSAGTQQSAQASNDIRSEIYSVGATLYFLLTGVALSEPALPSSLKLSKFPKPLRHLLRRMLHRDPARRPKDLVVLAEMIRECLVKIERRRELADRYGLPLRTTVRRPAAVGTGRFVRRALPIAAVLLAAAVLAAVLLAEPIRKIVNWTGGPKPIGVVVGVPQSSSSPAVQNASRTAGPATAPSQPANAAVPGANEPVVNAAPSSNLPQAASQDVQQAQAPNVQPETAAPVAAANSPAAITETSASPSGATASSKPDVADQSASANQSSSQSKKKSVASASRRGQYGQGATQDSMSRGVRSVRARVVGITSDGRLILRLPSGRTAFVAPDGGESEFVPRQHRRRPMVDRDEMFGPPGQFEPDYFPND
jgi:serine/threonine protein kinase